MRRWTSTCSEGHLALISRRPAPPPGSQLQAQSVDRSEGCVVRCVVGSVAATVFPAAQNAQSRRKEPQIELSRPSHSLLLRTIGVRAGRQEGKGGVMASEQTTDVQLQSRSCRKIVHHHQE